MRRPFLALLIVLLSVSPSAADWQYEGFDIPIAYVDNGAAQLQFACRGGDFAVGYWVRAPHRQVRDAASMHLAITPDPARPADASMPGASFAQDIPLIHSDGASMVIRGPVAERWARIAQQAKGIIRMAYVRKSGATDIFDSNDFSARGSLAAIRQVLARCG